MTTAPEPRAEPRAPNNNLASAGRCRRHFDRRRGPVADVGVLSVLEGIAAVAEDELFVVGVEYVYEFDVTTWGWIHIVLGAVLIISAFGLITGTSSARGLAIAIAALSILANFLWLPYYPWWSILIIALNIVVIWAIATWRPRT